MLVENALELTRDKVESFIPGGLSEGGKNFVPITPATEFFPPSNSIPMYPLKPPSFTILSMR